MGLSLVHKKIYQNHILFLYLFSQAISLVGTFCPFRQGNYKYVWTYCHFLNFFAFVVVGFILSFLFCFLFLWLPILVLYLNCFFFFMSVHIVFFFFGLFFSWVVFLFVCFSIWKFPGWGSNWSCSCQSTPQPQQCQIWDTSMTYTVSHGNAKSLTHWARSGSNAHPHWY